MNWFAVIYSLLFPVLIIVLGLGCITLAYSYFSDSAFKKLGWFLTIIPILIFAFIYILISLQL